MGMNTVSNQIHKKARRFRFGLLLAMLAACVFSALPARSAEIRVGATSWYAGWKPMFEKDFMDATRHVFLSLTRVTRTRCDINSAFLYGPLFSIQFAERWSFSNVFVFSDGFRASGRTALAFYTVPGMDYIQEGIRIKKYDLDSTIGYNLTPYIKIFTGFKYQGYRYTGRLYKIPTMIPSFYGRFSTETNGYGAGLGIGFSWPLTERIGFVANISGLYINSGARSATKMLDEYLDYIRIDETMALHAFGGNGTVSLSCRIPEASVTLVLGGRYQFLRYRTDHADFFPYNPSAGYYSQPNQYLFQKMAVPNILTHDYNGAYDHFYGITLSAVYSFEV